MLTFLFASCSNLIDELTVTKEKEANYTVTISDKIENGTVTASPTTAAVGSEITLTAEAASGFTFGSYSVTDTDGNSVKVENGKFKMPASNVNVSATFTAVTYTVTIASGITNGTVNSDKTSAAKGDTVTLTIAASDGYELDTISVKDASNNEVTINEVTKGSAYTFTMVESNVTVSATFKLSAVTPTYIGTKAPSEAKSVGDIVFTDGSATPYSEDLTLTDDEKNAAIAVIFYVGTDCSNDSTSRTLGVGLAQNQSGLAWCLGSAKAYNVNITTIQESDKDGSDNLEQIEAFDGVDDTATEANYPAFYFAKNYASQTGSNVSGTDYEDGWYLPAKAELQKIYESLSTVNKELAACGGTEFNQYH